MSSDTISINSELPSKSSSISNISKYSLKKVKSKVDTGLSPNIVMKRISPLKGSGDNGTTTLPSGLVLSKSNKVFAATGILEELIANIGLLKAKYFPAENSSSKQLFISARLTKIQEDILSMINSMLSTPDLGSKFTNSRFGDSRKEDLLSAIAAMNTTPYKGLPGQTPLEADLYLTWTLSRRAERQISGIKDPKTGIIPEMAVLAYNNLLNDYFLHLISHVKATSL